MNSTGGVSTPPPSNMDGQGGGFGLQLAGGLQQGQRFVAQQLQAQQQYTGPGGQPGPPGTGLGGAYGGAFDQHNLLQQSNAHAVVAAHQQALLREQEAQALQRQQQQRRQQQQQQQQHLAGTPGGGMPLLDGPGPFGLAGGFQGPPDPFDQGQPGQHPAYGMMTGRPRFGGFGEPVEGSLRQLASTAQQPSHVGLLPGSFSHTVQQPNRQQLRGHYGPPDTIGNGNPSQDPYFDIRFENDAVLALEGMDNLSLNPMAEEFVPPLTTPDMVVDTVTSGTVAGKGVVKAVAVRLHKAGEVVAGVGVEVVVGGRSLAANVRRTIYICDVDSQVTERDLAVHFQDCGHINDCRVCGDPNSALRFAFIEFSDEDAVARALLMTGTMLGTSSLRVLRSKTAIVPVNNEYLPRSHQECELVVRTVYAANIDKKVEREDVRNFFETLCGRVSRLRLLGDYQHATRIAFVEFVHEEGAMAALNCSGATLGSLPIRVSPSKTPVRPDTRDDEVEGGGGPSNARRG
eukprot:CAMPEP_0177768570 /NCGR_PEP_ID=MMETSP0491_2-20121128/9798_1 /TAXON_ID=63592 /ORGANISM="Tetraselmis chuii, Strain PLY429" /LENGTH=514 /DNA_ID=CAMNT_0019285399 /DNA_START=264 /DNA_END=1809 /DNA_ORIENTATION=-